MVTTHDIDGLRVYDSGRAQSLPDNRGSTADERCVLLLPGLGNGVEFWAGVIEELGAARVVAIDLPGFGTSSLRPGLGMTLHGLSQSVGHYLVTHVPGPVVIVGHSLGGLVALQMASDFAVRCRRVVLVSATLHSASKLARNPLGVIRHPAQTWALAAQFVGSALPISTATASALADNNVLRRLLLRPFVDPSRAIDPDLLSKVLTSNAGGLAGPLSLRAARSVDVAQLMRDTPQPVDLIWGRHDLLIQAADIELARSLLRVERTLELSCGHWPHVEMPDETSAFLREAVLGDNS